MTTLIKVWLKVGVARLFKVFIPTLLFLISVFSLFISDLPNFHLGLNGYIYIFLFSALFSMLCYFPRRRFSYKLSSNDTSIEVLVADLFNQSTNLVIGFNDVFDTEPGKIINIDSVQGQFLKRVYNDNLSALDRAIEDGLKPYQKEKISEPNKKVGKRWRYPIGTTVSIKEPSGKIYFLVAYSKMGNNLTCTSSPDNLWLSLSNLWDKAHLEGENCPLSIPIIGPELSRTNLTRLILSKLIILSFITANRNKTITKKLTIVIHPNDWEKIDYYGLQDFLKVATKSA